MAKPKFRRSVLAVVAALLALSVSTSPLLAGPPQFFTLVGSDVFLIPGCAFPVEVNWHGTATGSLLLDHNGQFQMQINRWLDSGVTVTNVTTGKSLTSKTVAMDLIRFQRDGTLTQATNGLAGNFVVPGVGTVELDVGHIVLDVTTGEVVFVGGPHPVWIAGNIDALCQALS